MKNVKSLSYSNLFNERSILLILLATFLACIGIYIFQVIYLTENSYYFTSYQRKIKKFKGEVADLEAVYSQSLSLNDIQEKAEELGFQKIEKVKFVKAYNILAKKNK